MEGGTANRHDTSRCPRTTILISTSTALVRMLLWRSSLFVLVRYYEASTSYRRMSIDLGVYFLLRVRWPKQQQSTEESIIWWWKDDGR